jgi:2'-hydroxyisoflavone reductase
MRLLILGGTVFLSAEIAGQAVAAGDEVWCLTRGTTGAVPAGVRWVQSDRDAGPAAYADLSGEWDAVIDVSRSAPHARGALTALADRAAHWTYVSSCSVYARQDQPGADESAELLAPFEGPGTPATYGESKVASELAARSLVGDRLLVLRPGLIAGYGDVYGRLGYWPARFARDAHDDVLVPDVPWLRTQAISVVDQARFTLRGARDQLLGTYNTVSRSLPFGDVVDTAQQVAGHQGRQVLVAHDWLVERGVEEWMGPESLPLWLPWELRGFADRSVQAAYAVGLECRPMETLLAEDLAYERELGLLRERRAGLSPAYEAELLSAWRQR